MFDWIKTCWALVKRQNSIVTFLYGPKLFGLLYVEELGITFLIISRYIQERLNKRNCIPLYIQSLEVGPYELQCIIEDFILQHFESLVAKKHSRKICDLTRAQLCKLLASEKLLVTSEATVYKAVFQWVRNQFQFPWQIKYSLLKG